MAAVSEEVVVAVVGPTAATAAAALVAVAEVVAQHDTVHRRLNRSEHIAMHTHRHSQSQTTGVELHSTSRSAVFVSCGAV